MGQPAFPVSPTKTFQSDCWYTIRNNTKFGPFTRLELVHFLSRREILPVDFVWCAEMDQWEPLIKHIAGFSEIGSRPELLVAPEPLTIRQSPRIPVHIPIKAHDSHRLWMGCIESLSKGGALAQMKNPVLLPDSPLNLRIERILQTDQQISVNAEVIGKRVQKRELKQASEIYYSLRFTQVSNSAEEQIRKYMDRALATLPSCPKLRPGR